MRQYVTHSQRKTKSKFLFKNQYLTYQYTKIKLAMPLLDFFCIIGLKIPSLVAPWIYMYFTFQLFYYAYVFVQSLFPYRSQRAL